MTVEELGLLGMVAVMLGVAAWVSALVVSTLAAAASSVLVR